MRPKRLPLWRIRTYKYTRKTFDRLYRSASRDSSSTDCDDVYGWHPIWLRQQHNTLFYWCQKLYSPSSNKYFKYIKVINNVGNEAKFVTDTALRMPALNGTANTTSHTGAQPVQQAHCQQHEMGKGKRNWRFKFNSLIHLVNLEATTCHVAMSVSVTTSALLHSFFSLFFFIF